MGRAGAGLGRFWTRFGGKYLYSEEAAAAAPERIASILKFLDARVGYDSRARLRRRKTRGVVDVVVAVAGTGRRFQLGRLGA